MYLTAVRKANRGRDREACRYRANFPIAQETRFRYCHPILKRIRLGRTRLDATVTD